MRNLRLWFGAAGVFLFSTLLLQIWSYRADQRFSNNTRIETGSQLPLDPIPVIDDARVDLSCRIAFVVDADCRYCRQLAQSVSQESSKPSERPVWLSVSTVERTRWFAEEYDLKDVLRFDAPDDASPAEVLKALDISVTPTRLIFDVDETVTDIRLTSSMVRPSGEKTDCHS